MSEGNGKNKTILIIEDELPLLEAIGRKLKDSGFEVLTAQNTESAMDYLQNGTKIDLIWLDHYIFGKEPGLLFVAELKNDPNWKNIPIFVISNASGPEKKQAYISLGADKYYTKVDYRLEDICRDISEFLKK